MRRAIWLTGTAALALVASTGEAQEPTPQRQEPIEIRGTVPTPQVVTVRPRERPAYSRKVLVPNFYDHDFWPSILPAYRLVAERMVSGQAPADTMLRADTLGRLVPPPSRIDTMPLRPDTAQTIPPSRSPGPTTPPPAPDDGTLSHARPSPHGAGTASASSWRRQQTLTWIKRRL